MNCYCDGMIIIKVFIFQMEKAMETENSCAIVGILQKNCNKRRGKKKTLAGRKLKK
jgi:hypothetical protein